MKKKLTVLFFLLYMAIFSPVFAGEFRVPDVVRETYVYGFDIQIKNPPSGVQEGRGTKFYCDQNGQIDWILRVSDSRAVITDIGPLDWAIVFTLPTVTLERLTWDTSRRMIVMPGQEYSSEYLSIDLRLLPTQKRARELVAEFNNFAQSAGCPFRLRLEGRKLILDGSSWERKSGAHPITEVYPGNNGITPVP